MYAAHGSEEDESGESVVDWIQYDSESIGSAITDIEGKVAAQRSQGIKERIYVVSAKLIKHYGKHLGWPKGAGTKYKSQSLGRMTTLTLLTIARRKWYNRGCSTRT
jgi:hypothetical protein